MIIKHLHPVLPEILNHSVRLPSLNFFYFYFCVRLLCLFIFCQIGFFALICQGGGYFGVNFMFSCFCCWDNNRYMPFFGSLYEKLGTFAPWVVYEYPLGYKVAKICFYKGYF